MIIIGQRLNSKSKSIMAAIEKKDCSTIQDISRRQYEEGASFIDVNASEFGPNEAKKLKWLVTTAQDATDAPFSFASTDPVALEEVLKLNKNGKPIINSITDEKSRFDTIMPLISEYNTAIIALCMDDSGMPETVEDRVIIADRLIGKLVKKGVAMNDIYIDPMVRPIGTGSCNGVIAIETIRKVKSEFPEAHIACGVSNISFGVPARKLLNQAFLIAAMTAGMDGAIMDPLDKKLMAFLTAGEALLGIDSFCMNYLMKFREGLLDV